MDPMERSAAFLNWNAVHGTPRRATSLASPRASSTFILPMQLQWHERTHRDPGSRYFRELVVEAAREGPAGLMSRM
jgi:hypothetical protein